MFPADASNPSYSIAGYPRNEQPVGPQQPLVESNVRSLSALHIRTSRSKRRRGKPSSLVCNCGCSSDCDSDSPGSDINSGVGAGSDENKHSGVGDKEEQKEKEGADPDNDCSSVRAHASSNSRTTSARVRDLGEWQRLARRRRQEESGMWWEDRGGFAEGASWEVCPSREGSSTSAPPLIRWPPPAVTPPPRDSERNMVSPAGVLARGLRRRLPASAHPSFAFTSREEEAWEEGWVEGFLRGRSSASEKTAAALNSWTCLDKGSAKDPQR